MWVTSRAVPVTVPLKNSISREGYRRPALKGSAEWARPKNESVGTPLTNA